MVYNFSKRILDLIIGLVALIVLMPIWLTVIVLLKFTGDREAFFFQKRLGYKNHVFDVLKFVTMSKDSENKGTKDMTLRDDPRVTKIGKFLRRSKINELPQILNVLKGEMSIVGPRPLMLVSFEMYDDDVKPLVYNSKPGITGIGSLIFRDEEAMVSVADMPPRKFYETVIYPYKGEVEMWYQNHKCTWTDIKIIFLTAWSILFSKSRLYESWFKDLPKRNF